MRIRKNIHERAVPDFVFFRFSADDKMEAIFVEVKPPGHHQIKPHQDMIRRIFEKLGIEVKIAFGVNEDGSPNFKETH